MGASSLVPPQPIRPRSMARASVQDNHLFIFIIVFLLRFRGIATPHLYAFSVYHGKDYKY